MVRGGATVDVRAAKEVILAGGSYNSPQLLLLSGIGPVDELKRHGIEVRHALKGVGENLRDHWSPRMKWYVAPWRAIAWRTWVSLSARASGACGARCA